MIVVWDTVTIVIPEPKKYLLFTPLGILLLLLCVVSFEVPNAKTRPIDFVCNAHARRNMNNMKDLEVAMVRQKLGNHTEIHTLCLSYLFLGLLAVNLQPTHFCNYAPTIRSREKSGHG